MTAATLEKPGFRLERSIHVDAAATAVFPLVADFHRWVDWSPYEGLDPNMKRTYEGSAQGVGAVYGWEGDRKVGTGRMEILRADAPSKVLIKLDFLKPFEGHNTAEFSFVPEADGTKVTWAMYGAEMCPNPIMKFFMGLFFNMEKMVGGQFEQGLAKLKTAAEAAA